MAAHGPLAEDHQGAGQNIGALDGDRHRQCVVGRSHEVARAELDGAPTDHVHAAIDQVAHALGGVVFGHGRQHPGGAIFQAAGDQLAHGLQGIGAGGDFRCRFLHALELADFHVELAAYARKGAHGEVTHFATSGGQRWQRDAPPRSQAFDQHAPALPRHLRAADNPVRGDEHVLALDRAIHEG